MKKLKFQLKIILFLILAGGLVFAGYKLGQRQAFPDVQPSFKITPDQAIEIAQNAIPEKNIKRTTVDVSDHTKYGKVWQVNLIIKESSLEAKGKTVLINGESGEVLEITELTILP